VGQEAVDVLKLIKDGIYRVRALVGAQKVEESKISCSNSIESAECHLKQLIVALDTCASTNIIRKDMLPKDVLIRPLEASRCPRIRDASNKLLAFEGVSFLRLQVGGLD
jgi:hypothetical protein